MSLPSRIPFRLLIIIMLATGCGSGTESPSDKGDGGPASQSATCETNDECLVGTCCSCGPRSIHDDPLDCAGLGCASPDCSGLSPVCGDDGHCDVELANCDDRNVTCEVATPACEIAGYLPVVNQDGTCYTGACAPIQNCNDDCGETPCPWRCPANGDIVEFAQTGETVILTNSDGFQYQCTLVNDQNGGIDCANDPVVGTTLPVLGGSSQNCATETFNVAVGNPQECTYQCTRI